MMSITTVVQDKDGNVDRLAVYNGDRNVAAAEVLSHNTVFGIKEPFYKATMDGGYTLRVDHPSDLVLLRSDDPLVPVELHPSLVELHPSLVELKGLMNWKEEGNEAYKSQNYLHAVNAYSAGLASCTDTDSLLRYDVLRNRAIANLCLQRYDCAYSDALASITPNDTVVGLEKFRTLNNKAHYRAGRAAYYLGMFEEAKFRFDEALSLVPDDKDDVRELSRACDRLKEQETGEYDFYAMSRSVTGAHNRLDHASFTAVVAVRDAGHRGRGLFATRTVKAGNIVMAEKAFCVAHETETGNITYTLVNLNTNRGYMGTHAIRLFKSVQKMLHNSAEARPLLGLHDGGYSPKCQGDVVDGVTAVDVFQTQSILECNGFGCPKVRSTDETKEKEQQAALGSTGVWITASYINHACDGNARRSFIGDMVIVRATRGILKDEAVFMPYCKPEDDSEKVQAALLKGWQFKCDCIICTAQEKTSLGDLKHRRRLLIEVNHFLTTNRQSENYPPDTDTIVKGEQLYIEIETTYPEHVFKDVPRLGLIGLSLWLCAARHTAFTPQKVIDNAIETLRNMGYMIDISGPTVLVDRTRAYLDMAAIHATMYATHALIQKGNRDIASQMEDFAKELYVTLFGELRGFEKQFGGGL